MSQCDTYQGNSEMLVKSPPNTRLTNCAPSPHSSFRGSKFSSTTSWSNRSVNVLIFIILRMLCWLRSDKCWEIVSFMAASASLSVIFGRLFKSMDNDGFLRNSNKVNFSIRRIWNGNNETWSKFCKLTDIHCHCTGNKRLFHREKGDFHFAVRARNWYSQWLAPMCISSCMPHNLP